TAAENLQPIFAFAEPDLALVAPALDIDLERGLGKWKERRPKPHFDVIYLEKRFAELGENPFQVPEVRTLVDDAAFDLVKQGRVCLIGGATIGAARNNHADRRLLTKHRADLHWRGVGAQEQTRAVGLRIEEERVVHVAGRMGFRKIQLGEVEVV